MFSFNSLVLLSANPFTKVTTFVTTNTDSILKLCIAFFTLGFIFCGAMVWNGAEENVPKFKKMMFWSAAGLAVAVLASVIVSWVSKGVA